MRRSTALMSQWQADKQSGEGLHFELCKGGYFSTKDEYGLKVIGKTAQEGTPTSEAPIPIQCVKQGTNIICGDSYITIPCDLYRGDVWHPMSGRVERHSHKLVLTGDEAFRSNGSSSGKGYERLVYDFPNNNYPPYSTSTSKNDWLYCNVTSWIAHWYIYNAGWAGTTVFREGKVYCAFGYKTFAPNATSKEEVISQSKAVIKALYEAGTPVTIVYKLANPIIEQYEPQPIFAAKGTVNVLQLPTDLSAELEATMLKK